MADKNSGKLIGNQPFTVKLEGASSQNAKDDDKDGIIYLKDLKAEHPQLSTMVAYEFPQDSEVKGEDYDVAGRLDLSTLSDEQLPKDADYYLCGPVPFMQQQHKVLVARGISPEQIHTEAFGTGGVTFS